MKNLGKYIALISILLASFATVLNTSMTRIAAPSVQEVFGINYSQLTWIFNGYQIFYAVLLPVFGLLGDRSGRRKMLLGGLVVFGVGSFLCGISWSFPTLITFRIVQALGAAAIFPNAVVIGTGLFPKEQHGRIMGLWGTAISMGSVAGPTIGGFIIQYLGWKYIFFVNIAFVVLVLASITSMVKSDALGEFEKRSFDYLGTVVLATIVISLVTALTTGSEQGWNNPLVLGLTALFALAAIAFPKIERNAKYPVIDLNLFRNKVFIAGTLCGGMHLVAIQGMNFLMPLFLTSVRGMDALSIGVMMLPQAMIRLVISPLAGLLVDRYGSRIPVAAGLVIRTIALSSFAFLTPSSSSLVITATLLADGTGAALIWAPSMNAVLEATDRTKASSVTGVFNMLRFILGVVGTVIAGLIMDTFFTSIPSKTAPVPGFFHSYLLLASMTACGLLVVGRLGLRTGTTKGQTVARS